MNSNIRETTIGPPIAASSKSATVRRVFGDILETVKDVEISLCYSTSTVDGSPCRTERSSVTTTEADNIVSLSGGVVAKPFASILSESGTNKENALVNLQSLNPVSEENQSNTSQVANERKDLLRRLRQQAQSSSQRSIMALKAQDAITKATKSVNRSLDVVRYQNNQLQEFKQFHVETEQSRRDLLKLKQEISSSFRKSKAIQQKVARLNQLEKIEKESQFHSEVFRDHVNALKEERGKKRRDSNEAKLKLRENHRQGKMKMQLQRIEEDKILFEERQLSFRASQEEKIRIAQNRRKSYQFRNGDARRIREIHAKIKALELKDERERYELKWRGESDAKEFHKGEAEKRRQSLAARNAEAKRQKDLGDRNRSEQLAKEHESYELKWAGEKDAEQYKLEMQSNFRKSLAARNNERAQHAKVMNELRSIAKEKETESYMLKWAGENDAKEYLAKIARQRRESLQQRNRLGKAHRDWDAENRQRQQEEAHADAELRAAGQRDAELYKKECAEQRRASLELRGKEASIQRLEEQQRKQEERDIESTNRELEDQARKDVAEYFRECKQRRRMSLAFRAKERRHHVEWEKQQAAKLLEQQRLETEGRTMDYCHLERAKQQERVRVVIDTLRQAGCEFDEAVFSLLLK